MRHSSCCPPLGALVCRPWATSAFQSSPARGGRVQLQQAFAIHGAFQRFNPHPPVGGGCNGISTMSFSATARRRFNPHPPVGGGCNPYPQHTPSASVVARKRGQFDHVISGWSVGARVGVDTDGTDGTVISEKSLKARVLGIFREYLFHLFHLFHACGAPKKPRAVLGGREARRAWRNNSSLRSCSKGGGERLSSVQ